MAVFFVISMLSLYLVMDYEDSKRGRGVYFKNRCEEV